VITCTAGSQLFQMQSSQCNVISKFVFVFIIRQIVNESTICIHRIWIFISFVTSLSVFNIHLIIKRQLLTVSDVIQLTDTLFDFKVFMCINSDTHCCHVSTAIKHPMPEQVKPLFVIFDIRALWHSTITHMATVGVKGLVQLWFYQSALCPSERDSRLSWSAVATGTWLITMRSNRRKQAADLSCWL